MKDYAHLSSILKSGPHPYSPEWLLDSSHYSQSPGDMMVELRHEANLAPENLGNVMSSSVLAKIKRK